MEEAKAESPKREPSADVKKKNNNINTSNLDENPGKMANNGGGDLFAECQHHLATINMATEYHQAMKEEIRKFCKLQRAIAQKKNNQVERLSRLVDSKNTKSQQNANWMTQSVQTLIGFLTRQAKAHSSVTDTLAKQSSRVQTFLDQHNQAMNSIIHNPGSSVNFSDPVPLPPATAPPPFFTSNPYNTQAENFIDNATHGGVGVISAPTNMATILPSSPRRKNSKRQFQSNSLNARSSSISSIPNNAPMGGISPTYQMLQKQQQEQQQQQQQQQQQKQEPQQEKQKQLKQKHQLSPSRQPWHLSPPPPSARRQQQQKQQQQRQQHQQAQQQQQIDHQPNQQQKHQHQPQLQTEQHQQNMLPCYPSWGDFDFGAPPNQVNNNSNQHSMNDFLSASVRYERVRRDRLTLANRIQYLQMQQKSINDQLDEAKVIMADIHDVTSSKQWSWSAQSKMGDLRSRMEFLKNQKLHTLNELDQAKMDMMRFDEQHARQMERVKDVFEATRTKYERSLRQTISVLRAAVIADTGSFRSGLGLGIGTNQDPHPKQWEKFENDGSDNLEIMEDNGVRKSSPPRSAFGKVGDGMECLCREDTQNKSDSNSVSSSVEHSENMMTISDFLEQNLTDESGENFGCYRNKKTNVFGGTDALTLGSTSVDGCGRIDSDLTPVAMDTYLKTGRFNHSPLQVVQSNWSTNRNDGDDSTDDDTHRENSEEDVVYDDDIIEDADIDDIDDKGDRKEENNKTNNHDVGRESTTAMTTRDDVTIHAQSNTIVQYSVVPKDTRFVMEKNSPMSDGAQRAKSENCSPMIGELHVMPEETNAGVTSSENGQNHIVEDIVHHDNDLQYENRECGTKEDEVIGRYIEKYLNTREPSVSINSSLPGDHSFGLPVEPVWVRPGATTSSLPESPITIMLSKESKRKLRVCTVHPIASSTNSPGSHETVELQASRRLPHSRNVVDSQKNKVMNGSCRQEYLMTENVQQSINHGSSVEEANTGHYFHQGLQNTTTRSQEHNEHCHDSLQSSSQNRKKLFSLKQECSKEIVGRNDMKISPTKSNTDGCLFKSNMDIGGAGKSRICHQTEVEETATEKTVLRMYVNTIKQHDRDITSAVHALSQAVRQDQNNFIDNTLLDHQRLRTVNEAACKPGYLKSADTNISEHHERHHQFNTSENKEGNANDVMIPSHSRQIANHTPQSPLETAQLRRPSPSFVLTSKGAEIHHAPAMSDTSFSGDGTLKQSDGSGDNISLHRQHQQHHHQQQEKQEPGQKFVDKVASAGSHIIGDHNSSTLHQASSSESDLDSSESPTFTTSLSSSINVDTESDTSFLPASAKDDNRNYNKSQKQHARSKKSSEKARTNVFVGSVDAGGIIKRASSGQKCVRFSEQIEYSPLELASCERLEGFMNEDDDNDDAVAGGGGGGK